MGFEFFTARELNRSVFTFTIWAVRYNNLNLEQQSVLQFWIWSIRCCGFCLLYREGGFGFKRLAYGYIMSIVLSITIWNVGTWMLSLQFGNTESHVSKLESIWSNSKSQFVWSFDAVFSLQFGLRNHTWVKVLWNLNFWAIEITIICVKFRRGIKFRKQMISWSQPFTTPSL